MAGGVHFGSHSPFSQLLDCDLQDNGSDGLYLCWGVDHSLVRGNQIHHNGFRLHRNGISLGHKDTDDIIEKNHIFENAKHGICIRRKTEANGAHRTTIRDNVIENNGRPAKDVPENLRRDPATELEFAGVYVMGVTHDVTITNNILRETRQGEDRTQRHGVYIGKDVSRVTLKDNDMSGLLGDPVVNESGGGKP